MSTSPRRWRDGDSAPEGMAALVRSADDDSPTTQQLADLAARFEPRATARAVPAVPRAASLRWFWLAGPLLAAAALALFLGLRTTAQPNDIPSEKPTNTVAAAQIDTPPATHGSVVIATATTDSPIFVDGILVGRGEVEMTEPIGTVLHIACGRASTSPGQGSVTATVASSAQTIECNPDIMYRDSTVEISTASKADLELNGETLGIATARLTRPYGTVETIRCFMGSRFGQVTVEWRGEFQTVECVLDGHRQKRRDKKTETVYPEPRPAPRTGAAP